MEKHQIAITAAGVSMTELLTIVIPSLIIYGTPHEREAAELIHKKNLALNICLVTNITKCVFWPSPTGGPD